MDKIFNKIAQCACVNGINSYNFPTPLAGEYHIGADGVKRMLWELSTGKDEWYRTCESTTDSITVERFRVFPLGLIDIDGTITHEYNGGIVKALGERDAEVESGSQIVFNPYFAGSVSDVPKDTPLLFSYSARFRFTCDTDKLVSDTIEYQQQLSEIAMSNADAMPTMSLHAVGVQYETENGTKIWCPEQRYYKGAHRAGCVALINNDFGDPVEGTEAITSGTFNILPRTGVENGATITIENNIITKFITPQE